MLVVRSPEAAGSSETPPWVDEWLQKRRAREEKQVVASTELAAAPADGRARDSGESSSATSWCAMDSIGSICGCATLFARGWRKQPPSQVRFGKNRPSDLWMPRQPDWPGAFARLALLPRSAPDWAQRLVGELGRIKLLLHAYNRIDELEPALANEVGS